MGVVGGHPEFQAPKSGRKWVGFVMKYDLRV
jgi:hypothetical protein